MLYFDIITIFPEVFEQYFSCSIIGRAQKKKLIKIRIHNLRDFTKDKHKTVDERPYGGGAGMILKVEPIYKALKTLTKFKVSGSRLKNVKKKTKIILLSAKGKQFDQSVAKSFSKLNQLILICGHYEGVDERVRKIVDQEIAVGPYILTGGELPAMIVVDATARLVPGVIRAASLREETGVKIEGRKVKIVKEYPQYTRPSALTVRDGFGNILTMKVPKVLLSGNHKEIKKWRNKH